MNATDIKTEVERITYRLMPHRGRIATEEIISLVTRAVADEKECCAKKCEVVMNATRVKDDRHRDYNEGYRDAAKFLGDVIRGE